MQNCWQARLSVAHNKHSKKVGWCRRNWVMVLLFGLGLLGLLFALLCFLEPCKEETVTKLIPQFVPAYANVTELQTTTVKSVVTVDVVKNARRFLS